MLWEVELRPLGDDAERRRVADAFDWLSGTSAGSRLVRRSARGFLLEGPLQPEHAPAIRELLGDPLVEDIRFAPLNALDADEPSDAIVTVVPKPGVMDPVAQSVVEAARELSLPIESVKTFRRYELGDGTDEQRERLVRKVLANEAIEQVIVGPLRHDHLTLGKPVAFQRIDVPLRDLDDDTLERLSRERHLALNREEMRAIRDHFRGLNRDPSDVELETLAQTWSEHCSHKTLRGPIDCIEPNGSVRRINGLLKETIFAATRAIRQQLGADDWCVSVFVDNAGVVRFDDAHHVCFKVETHNRPSAIEPYGGANTGLGGVIRDVLGTGRGAKPFANTDVFAFFPPDRSPEPLPTGVLHPRAVIHGVVAGVRDYGNRMGIPTVNGAVIFDERYLANPLVFCGTVGLLPTWAVEKAAQPGDLIVTVGGRTGRDGIHGATFSSEQLSERSEQVGGGAVQIGNAIAEKKVLDVLLVARDRGLYTAITDCGAGGFSSAVGEMAAELGARVDLDQAPLKYQGLTYAEIWISEAQERMVLAVPPGHWPALDELCRSEGVEAAVIGRFEATGRLRLFYTGHEVADLSMSFLHQGRPDVVRQAHRPATAHPWAGSPLAGSGNGAAEPATESLTEILLRILASPNVASKEWIVRQYDHEVQGGTVIKPLVGPNQDGPGDAAVLTPVLGSHRGVAIGCGINPWYGDLDPAAMAACAIDEAVRNVIAVGADPTRVAILDNFCWGHITDPDVLGSLVACAEACRDVAVAFGTPFISGKDSLNNEYRSATRRIVIPGTLLISALGLVPDVRRCVTMDLKEPGNGLFLVGSTRHELGGSHYHRVRNLQGGEPPRPNRNEAPAVFRAVHTIIQEGWIRSCHDLSEGGLAVAAAEMVMAGGIGADLATTAEVAAGHTDVVRLFAESPSRFLLEVRPEHEAGVRQALTGLPVVRVGVTVMEPRLRIAGQSGEWLIWAAIADLKSAWQGWSRAMTDTQTRA